MKYSAIVLAAGRSSRFGADKLRATLAGQPLLAHALAAARAAPVARIMLVARERPDWLDDEAVLLAKAGDAPLSASLRTGLAASADMDGAFVFLGDMPLVPHGIAASLAAGIGSAIAACPLCEGRAGHPVLLARAGFALADALEGDYGLGRVLRDRADVVRLETGQAGICFDVDTAADLARAERALAG